MTRFRLFQGPDNQEPDTFGIGPLELIVVLVVALLVFGPKRLPDLGRSLGSGMREFKESVTGADRDELANADVPNARQP